MLGRVILGRGGGRSSRRPVPGPTGARPRQPLGSVHSIAAHTLIGGESERSVRTGRRNAPASAHLPVPWRDGSTPAPLLDSSGSVREGDGGATPAPECAGPVV